LCVVFLPILYNIIFISRFF